MTQFTEDTLIQSCGEHCTWSIPLYDTSLALRVVNSWGQGGGGSLPSDEVVLVTTCTATIWLCLMDLFFFF